MRKDRVYTNFTNILQEYLDAKDRKEFAEIIDQKLSSELAPYVEEDVADDELNDRQRAIRRFQIDGLITFAEQKLSEPIYLDLMMNLGKVANDLAEYSLAESIFEKVINQSKTDLYEEMYAYAKIGLSDIYHNQARLDKAFSALEDAKIILSKTRDLFGLAKCENIMGVVNAERGNVHEARECFTDALSLLDAQAHQHMQAIVRNNLALVEVILTNYDAAIAAFYRVLKHFEKSNDEKAVANIRQNLANVYFKQGKFKLALKEAEASMSSAFDSEYLATIGSNYMLRSEISLFTDDTSLSIAFAEKSEDVSIKINDRFTIADLYRVKGQIHYELGEYKVAENHLLTSLRMNEELHNKGNYAEAAFELGILYKKLDKREDSLDYLTRALEYNKSIGATKIIEKIERAFLN